jgi:hypothetical protein
LCFLFFSISESFVAKLFWIHQVCASGGRREGHEVFLTLGVVIIDETCVNVLDYVWESVISFCETFCVHFVAWWRKYLCVNLFAFPNTGVATESSILLRNLVKKRKRRVGNHHSSHFVI